MCFLKFVVQYYSDHIYLVYRFGALVLAYDAYDAMISSNHVTLHYLFDMTLAIVIQQLWYSVNCAIS